MRTIVTIDFGNRRLKWRRWEIPEGVVPRITGSGAHPTRAGVGAAVLTDLGPAEPDRIACACVASLALEDELATALAARFGERFSPRPEPGLVLDLEGPGEVGCDRLFAARGAFACLQVGALVVDAGTCVTVDAVDAAEARRSSSLAGAPDVQTPRFRGGAIAPGPELLAEALARGGARLFAVEARGPVQALGRNTESALRSGVVIGLRGAVRELLTAIGAAAGLDDAPVVWTGGAAPLLCEPWLFPERRNVVEPELVHLGLLAALGVDLRRRV